MPNDEEIIAEMNKLREKMTSEKLAHHFKNWNKTMQYHFTDTDEYWYIKLVNGQPEEPVKGKVEKPEISYKMSTTDYFALMRNEVKGLKLYNSGRLKIKAAMPDILKLQKLN
ncbi:MAG: SCP2 sterol-binding domain-containing protein [Candidatus Heimdallarchaeota archaeon]